MPRHKPLMKRVAIAQSFLYAAKISRRCSAHFGWQPARENKGNNWNAPPGCSSPNSDNTVGATSHKAPSSSPSFLSLSSVNMCLAFFFGPAIMNGTLLVV